MPALRKKTKSPTPIEYLKYVSERLGVKVWCKREDYFCKQIVGGSKSRKLSRLIAHAVQNNATDIVTMGSTGSHHVQASSIWGEKFQLNVHAALVNQPYTEYAEKIYSSSKERLSTIDFAQNEIDCLYKSLMIYRKLKKIRNPYWIFPGGSNPLGNSAYLDAGLEVLNQSSILYDYQFCIFGTGGISSGLLAAKQRESSLPKIISIKVYPSFWNKNLFTKIQSKLLDNKFKLFQNCQSDLTILDNYIGDGYGTLDKKNREAIELFLLDGIVLEPIYMQRLGRALIEFVRANPKVQSILFWLTSPYFDK